MTKDCEFKTECEKAIVGECTHMEWRIQEGCGLRQFAILVGTKKWNEGIEATLEWLNEQSGLWTDDKARQTLKMEDP